MFLTVVSSPQYLTICLFSYSGFRAPCCNKKEARFSVRFLLYVYTMDHTVANRCMSYETSAFPFLLGLIHSTTGELLVGELLCIYRKQAQLTLKMPTMNVMVHHHSLNMPSQMTRSQSKYLELRTTTPYCMPSPPPEGLYDTKYSMPRYVSLQAHNNAFALASGS